MRLIGWGALWGLGVFLVPFVAFAAIGLVHEPQAVGYLLSSLPVVGAAGAVTGVLGGALAAAIAPLTRTGASTPARLTLCAVLYCVALTIAVAALFVIAVPADARPGQAPVVPIVCLIGTGLATWGFSRERRRARRITLTPPPPPAP